MKGVTWKRPGWKPHSNSMAFAATCLGANLMNQVFKFYYVRVYLDFYHIKESWFQWAQVVYMIWNAVNDPLFGYCQDNCKLSIVRSRRHTILYGAPLFAVSFLVPWFPWADYDEGSLLCALHLVVALCFYDAMYTYVVLANCCNFVEMSHKSEDRVRMVKYAQVASFVGSSSVFFCESISAHLSSYLKFQFCCIVLSILAWLFMTYTGLYSSTPYDLDQIQVDQDVGDKDKEHLVKNSGTEIHRGRSSEESIWRLTWQILSNSNFFWFVLMNVLTEYHSNFVANFSSIISDLLLQKDQASRWIWDLYYGAVVLLPRLVLLIISPLLTQLGYYKIYKVIFMLKISSGLLMYVCGPQHNWIFMMFILLDSVTSSVCGSMMGLPLSDIVDADRTKYSRKHPLSSMVFGTNALVTKPAISVAPMLTVYCLNKYGYSLYKAGQLADVSSLRTVTFAITCWTPIVVGCLQYALWSRYTIRRSHASDSKMDSSCCQ